MNSHDVIRAWKDPEYRENLSAEVKSHIPSSPAGLVELNEADLEAVAGAASPADTEGFLTFGCCPITTAVGFTVCGAVCSTGGSVFCC